MILSMEDAQFFQELFIERQLVLESVKEYSGWICSSGSCPSRSGRHGIVLHVGFCALQSWRGASRTWKANLVFLTLSVAIILTISSHSFDIDLLKCAEIMSRGCSRFEETDLSDENHLYHCLICLRTYWPYIVLAINTSTSLNFTFKQFLYI